MRLIDRISFLGKATVEPRPREEVEMGKVIWAARQGVERLIMQKSGQLIETDKWPVAEGVPAWLEVIWTNLLMNAFQHGGASPRVEVGCTELEEDFKFWVCDNGPGVPEAKRAALFHPFHRLHLRNSGAGLGLSIVQRLVELQGGRCGYEAATGGGGCFFFTLPRVSALAPQPL
jgi:signal transduction histidine kinase